MTDARDSVLDGLYGGVAAQNTPCELADGGNDREVDAMPYTFAELGEGALAVADAEHERCIGDVRLDLLGGNAQVNGGARHVAHDARTVCAVLHQCLPNVEQDLHLAVQHFVAVFCRTLYEFIFHGDHDLPFSFSKTFLIIAQRGSGGNADRLLSVVFLNEKDRRAAALRKIFLST